MRSLFRKFAKLAKAKPRERERRARYTKAHKRKTKKRERDNETETETPLRCVHRYTSCKLHYDLIKTKAPPTFSVRCTQTLPRRPRFRFSNWPKFSQNCRQINESSVSRGLPPDSDLINFSIIRIN